MMIHTAAAMVPFLRALAEFYEAHPDLPIPYDMQFTFHNVYVHNEALEVLHALGGFEKRFEDDRFIAVKHLAGHELRFSCNREEVCVPRVVGKRTIEAHVIPAKFEPEQVIPEHDEDIIEWDCEPVMAPKEQEVA